MFPECHGIWVYSCGAGGVMTQAGGLRACMAAAGAARRCGGCMHGKATVSILCGVPDTRRRKTVAEDAHTRKQVTNKTSPGLRSYATSKSHITLYVTVATFA